MEEVSKTSALAEIAPKATEDASTANPQPVDAKESADQLAQRYKDLESAYTRSRQSEIAFATKAARIDPKTLMEISDAKVQAAAVREIYGLESLSQVKDALGEEFWKFKSKEEDGEGKAETDKQIKLLSMKLDSERLESAVSAFKLANPSLITSEKDEDLLRSEMRLISTELSPAERVSKAARLAFGEVEGNKAKALKVLQNSAAGSGTPSQDNNDSGNEGGNDLKSYLLEALNPYKKK